MIVHQTGIVSELVASAPSCHAPISVATTQALPSLVVTGLERLRHRLRLITEARGCACCTPVSVAAAWRNLAAGPRLAFVDIAHPLDGRLDDTLKIAETLAAHPGVLLVVCGSGDAQERWAREVGAFVYLPEIGADTGLTLVVDEARRIAGAMPAFLAEKLPGPEP